MTDTIYPCIWFDNTAKAAADLYRKALGEGALISDQGMAVDFTLHGQRFMGLNGGPMFPVNPSISFFTVFDSETDITTAWETLSDDGTVLMDFDAYPWADKYGWVQDKYGVSWQLSLSQYHTVEQKITPLLTFANQQAGLTASALNFYTNIFPDSSIDMTVEYESGDGDTQGFIKHSRFRLCGYGLMAMDSTGPHKFGFNEGISLVVTCSDQKEIDYYWDQLGDKGQEQQCGWLADQYGVRWQIVPRTLGDYLANPDPEKASYAQQALMSMKKIVIADLAR